MLVKISRPPILLIEDNPRHRDQIEATIKSLGVGDVHSLVTARKLDAITFKASYPDNFIVIVDLDLTDDEAFNRDNSVLLDGLNLARDLFFLQDRTTVFLVFSAKSFSGALTDTSPPLQIKYLTKKIEPGPEKRIAQSALGKLKAQVLAASELQIPQLWHPDYRYLGLDQKSEIRKAIKPDNTSDELNSTEQAILRSSEKLENLANFCAQFDRAGVNSAKIAVGVFGSVGRLEASPTSDIELCIYVDGDMGAASLQDSNLQKLAVGCWNRLFKYCEKKADGGRHPDWKLETSAETPSHGLLEEHHIRFSRRSGLENKFYPILPLDMLEFDGSQVDRSKNAHLFLRYYQILCEVRPIFNANLISETKIQLLLAGRTAPDHNQKMRLSVLLGGSNIIGMIKHMSWVFEIPVGGNNAAHIKSVLFRFFGLQATGLTILRILGQPDSTTHRSPRHQWEKAILSELSDHPVVKLAKFLSFLKEKDRKFSSSADALKDDVKHIIDLHLAIADQLIDIKSSQHNSEEMSYIFETVRGDIQETIETYSRVFEALKNSDYWRQRADESLLHAIFDSSSRSVAFERWRNW